MKLKTALALLLTGSVSLFGADSTIINLTTLTGLADADSFVVVDASDTTQSAQGTTKDITTLNVLSFLYSDTALAGSWNGVTGGASASGAVPTKNAIHDYVITFDADLDGKVDVIDTAAAGFPSFNSSGAFVASRSVAEGAAIDVTNGDGASGNPTVAFDSTEVEATTWGAGGNASNIWTFNLSGTDPVITFSTGAVNVSTGTLQQGGVDVVTTSGTQTLSNKTATTPSAGDNDTSVATTAFVNTQTRGSNTGTHATPSTSNPLTLTFDAIMHSVWYGATGEIDLPAAASYTGRGFVVYNTGAFTITLDPNSSEIIVRDGTVQTGGVSMTLSTGAGNYVALISDGERWIVLGFKGTLAAGS